ncbi:hypothetical protein HOK021_42270 [Streptomyces hygroscopicus]|nr:hypothetical protein HOK021_42270 [Streptomyces hygroscopicus]
MDLSVTPGALELLERYDRAGRETLEQAMDKLPPGDRDTLTAAMPALACLVTTLGG